MKSLKSILFVLMVFSFVLVSLPQIEVVKAESKAIVVPDDYSSIQEAVDHASAGDTVYVKKGIYLVDGVAGITIDKPLSLVGEDSQKTIIQSEASIHYGESSTIHITADNVTVTGFTIIGNRMGDVGIKLENYDVDQLSDCKIIGNVISNNSDSGILTRGNSEKIVISGNNITDNSFGIYLSSSDSVVSGNYIARNDDVGIIIVTAKNVTINQNNIMGNGKETHLIFRSGGLYIRYWGPHYVYENNITNNFGFGVQFGDFCSHSVVYNNNIVHNQRGINLFNFEHPFGVNNTVYNNNLIDNSLNAFVEHTFPYDIPFVINGTTDVSWDNGKEGNYWSDYADRYPNATELDGSGICDTPYVLDENNQDNYPLMNPMAFPEILETTPPTISIVSPENKTYPINNVSLTFTVSEPTSGIGYSLDGQENVAIDGNTTLTELSDGSHSLIVYATDTAGNTGASETVYFSIEVPPPEPKPSEPFPITWIAAATAIIAIVGAILLIYFRKTRKQQ